jgi:hypothetical protein
MMRFAFSIEVGLLYRRRVRQWLRGLQASGVEIEFTESLGLIERTFRVRGTPAAVLAVRAKLREIEECVK